MGVWLKPVSKIGSKWSNWRQKHKMSIWGEVWRQLETKQNLSRQWRSRFGWLKNCFDQVHDRLHCFTLQSFEGGRGAQQSGLSSQTQKQNSVWHRRRLTVQPQYLRFMTEHKTSAAISGTDSVCKPLTESWLLGLGHIDLCMQLMIKPTISGQN